MGLSQNEKIYKKGPSQNKKNYAFYSIIFFIKIQKTIVFFWKKYIIIYVRKGMIFLEEIIKKLIEFDEDAKNKINSVKQKEENIEEEINSKLKSEKEKIDNQYVFKRKSLKEKYDKIYQENCERINSEKEKQINSLRQKYQEEGSSIVDKIVNSIINI